MPAAGTPRDALGDRLYAEGQRLAAGLVERDDHERHESLRRVDSARSGHDLVDATSHFAYLAEAVAWNRISLFTRYVAWAKVVLAHRGVAEADLRRSLERLRQALVETLGGAAAVPCQALDAALAQLPAYPVLLPSYLRPDDPLHDVAAGYLMAVLRLQADAAVDLVRAELDRGTAGADLTAHVFDPVGREVGRLWQTGQVSVAEEHFCTATTRRVFTELGSRLYPAAEGDRGALLLCVDGEQHDLGLRIVADALATDGWAPLCLGASVPMAGAIALLATGAYDLLGLSVTTTPRLRCLHLALRQLRAADLPRVPVLVGGGAFHDEPDLWRQVGADGQAADAGGGIAAARALCP